MTNKKEILNKLGNWKFIDFYDQKEHKVSDIRGFMNLLTKALDEVERGGMKNAFRLVEELIDSKLNHDKNKG